MDSRNPAPAAAGVFESGPLRGKEFTFRRPAAAPEPASAAGAAPSERELIADLQRQLEALTVEVRTIKTEVEEARRAQARRNASPPPPNEKYTGSPSTGKIHKVSKVSGQNPTCPALRMKGKILWPEFSSEEALRASDPKYNKEGARCRNCWR
eukprot:tig00001049_g6671.t1